MSTIDTTPTRSTFFPKKDDGNSVIKTKNVGKIIKRNDLKRKNALDEMAKNDSKVQIPEGIKEFARIKNAVDQAPDIDKSDKIALLKQQIADGNYNIDYEAIADKMLAQEF